VVLPSDRVKVRGASKPDVEMAEHAMFPLTVSRPSFAGAVPTVIRSNSAGVDPVCVKTPCVSRSFAVILSDTSRVSNSPVLTPDKLRGIYLT